MGCDVAEDKVRRTLNGKGSKRLTQMLLALTLAGCSMVPSQSDNAAKICSIDEFSKFHECFKREFPVGSLATNARQFLLDSGFRGPKNDAKIVTPCQSYTWFAQDFSSRSKTIIICHESNTIQSIQSFD